MTDEVPTRRWFSLMYQTEPVTAKPWRIAETIVTLDGPRTRLTDHCFRFEAEAWQKLGKLNKEGDNR